MRSCDISGLFLLSASSPVKMSDRDIPDSKTTPPRRKRRCHSLVLSPPRPSASTPLHLAQNGEVGSSLPYPSRHRWQSTPSWPSLHEPNSEVAFGARQMKECPSSRLASQALNPMGQEGLVQ